MVGSVEEAEDRVGDSGAEGDDDEDADADGREGDVDRSSLGDSSGGAAPARDPASLGRTTTVLRSSVERGGLLDVRTVPRDLSRFDKLPSVLGEKDKTDRFSV